MANSTNSIPATGDTRAEEPFNADRARRKLLAQAQARPRENAAPSGHKRDDQIRARAYELWEREGRPDGRHAIHWFQALHEIENDDGEIQGDDLPSMEALREAAREHTDAFLVKTDLEDADQRSIPGTREQP